MLSAPRLQARACDRRPFDLDVLEVAMGGICGLDVARRLGINARQVHRWRKTGLTVHQADVLAVRAGFHPAEVWPDW